MFMVSAKIATPERKIKVLWKKVYDVITYVYDVTNEFFSRDSNYNVHLVMWPKFGNSIFPMRKVIITSILQGFDQRNHFLWRVVLVQVQ